MSEAKDTPPIPYYPSRRLIGLELEYAAGSNGVYHRPDVPNGWLAKSDGSLHNGGEEFVLEPPLPLVEALPAVEEFSKASIKAKTYLAKLGGYHIHVQVHDLSIEDATRVVQLYWRFQDQIDMLCGQSRRSKPVPNEYALPFDVDHMPTEPELDDMFQLSYPAANRPDAKRSRQKRVVNLAMMRCSNLLHRSIEFRQPSPSKLTVNIYGWACFACGLVEIAKHKKFCNVFIKSRQASWPKFLALCRRIERVTGARQLVEWVTWRKNYLAVQPDQEKLDKLYSGLVDKAHGLFYISRRLNVNLAVASALVANEVAKGRLVVEAPGKWRVRYDAVAPRDLKIIMKRWGREDQAQAQLAAAPAPTVQGAPVLQPQD